MLGCKQCRSPLETKHQSLNICPFIMCNLIHACQTAIFDWLKHSICINMKCRERKKKSAFLLGWFIFCLTAAQYSIVRWSHPIQWSIHLLYIHQSTHHRYLFILCGPGWLECLHSSEWEKRKVSFLCTVYFAKNILLAFPSEPLQSAHQRPSIGWHSLNWLMRNVPTVLFAEV